MVSPTLTRVLTAVRLLLVVTGGVVTAFTAWYLASLPPPPPGSDGFAHGMAGLVGGLAMLAALGVATLAVVLPALLGWDDPLGFDRRQRRALRLAAALVGLGLVAAVVGGLEGAMLLLGLLLLAFVVVGAMLVWRLAEVLTGRTRGTDGAG